MSAADIDLLVVGSGAAGLATAVAAAALGLRVRVIDKADQLGGTSAWSGGWMWAPRNPLAVAAGVDDSDEAVWRYLRHELGEHLDEARVQAFLTHSPRMLSFFVAHSALRLVDGHLIPDFHGHSPGAARGGRSVCAAPFDGRRLGRHLHRLRPPLPETTLWGMGIASGADLRHFFQARRSLRSLWHVLGRLSRHGLQRLVHGRGTHLVGGNALVGALLHTALQQGVSVQERSGLQSLWVEGGRVIGAVVSSAAGPQQVRARCGVVLACGGFPHDATRMASLFPGALVNGAHPSAAPLENTGDGLRLAQAVGAQLKTDLAAPAAWAPVSLVPRADGSVGHFPHLIERGKPGLIAVTRAGVRFANEANSYYDMMSALFKALPPGAPVEAWLLCDHAFIRRWGLGAQKPAPMPLRPLLRSGYLMSAPDWPGLAAACGIYAAALSRTVAEFNRHAQQGEDPAFGRGDTPYNRLQGDEAHTPNPCVAQLLKPPFYAVSIAPGSLGTFAGLRTDAQARVLGGEGTPVAGLWACGNDAASVMGGQYPSGGITLGPALTFAYLAAHSAAGVTPP